MSEENLMIDKLCCPQLTRHVTQFCEQHGYDCPDKAIVIGKAWRAMPNRLLLSAPNAAYSFKYCPWCATRLPETINRESAWIPEKMRANLVIED